MSHFSTTHCRYSLAVFGVLFLFLSAGTASAIPISDYQLNLKFAIATLDHLSQSGDDFHRELAGAIESVRTKLPKQQTVEFEGEVCNVDNSWLHKGLDELAQADDPTEKLAHIIWTLQAIETRVAEREKPGGSAAENKEWARTRLESILARPEYVTDTQGSNALIRLLRDFFEHTTQPFEGGDGVRSAIAERGTPPLLRSAVRRKRLPSRSRRARSCASSPVARSEPRSFRSSSSCPATGCSSRSSRRRLAPEPASRLVPGPASRLAAGRCCLQGNVFGPKRMRSPSSRVSIASGATFGPEADAIGPLRSKTLPLRQHPGRAPLAAWTDRSI